MLPVTGNEAGQEQSPQEQTLFPQSEGVDVVGGGGGDGGGELAELGDEFGEGEDGDEAAEPAGEDVCVLGEEVGLEGIEGFGEWWMGFWGV